MLKPFAAALMCLFAAAAAEAESLRFFGAATDDADRVKIPIDPHTPADIGATNFTIEFWIKPTAGNNAGAISPGDNYDWIDGNIVLDRDRYLAPRAFGVSLTAGRITFGLKNGSGDVRTWRGITDLRASGQWHHVAIQRSLSGAVQIYIDGQREVNEASGPSGNLDYPNGAQPGPHCPPPTPCTNSDPYLVIGAEKHDVDRQQYPPFRGYFTELRLSTSLRYSDASFVVPSARFPVDGDTAALYHLDHGTSGADCTTSTSIIDSTGGSNGFCKFDSSSGGPEWSADSPFTPNPGVLQFTTAPQSASEGSSSATVSVSRTGGSLGPAAVTIAASGGTATQGADFNLPSSATLNWADGESGAKTFDVTIIDDSAPEANETVMLALTDESGASLGSRREATLTLTDNDGGSAQTLQFASASAAVNESAGSVQITVTRTGSTAGEARVSYATSNGSASSGEDYAPASGVLTFADGDLDESITVQLTNDAAVEADETFTVALSSPSGAELGAASTMTVTIRNDDAGSAPPPPAASGGGGGGGSFGAFMIALALLLVGRGHRERAGA